jgi:hypothetical protein
LRNSGFDTISTGIDVTLAISAFTRSPVPTGTVDLSTTTIGRVSARPMSRATPSTWERSALPSSPSGVPTAMNATSVFAIAVGRSVEKNRRFFLTLRFTISSRPGS